MLRDLGINIDILILVMLLFILVLIIMVLIQSSKMSKLTQIYKKYMTGANGKSLADRFEDSFGKMDDIRGDITEHEARIVRLESSKANGFSKFAYKKYDAFRDIAGKLSFTMCMLDNDDDGFILTSVHNAEGCYTYFKPVKGGKPVDQLSSEEKSVLEEAVEYKDPIAEIINRKK